MDDLERYISSRKQRDREFAQDFDGYLSFKLGTLLSEARTDANLSLETIANRLRIDPATVDRIESHTEEFAIAMLEEYAQAVGKELSFQLR